MSKKTTRPMKKVVSKIVEPLVTPLVTPLVEPLVTPVVAEQVIADETIVTPIVTPLVDETITDEQPVNEVDNEVDNEVVIIPTNEDSVSGPITGLGDVVAAVTKFFGVEPCEDCERRREAMNRMFSFLRVASRELTAEEIEYVNEIERTKEVPNGEVFVRLFNEIYNANQSPCNCPGIYKDILEKFVLQVKYQEIK